MKLPNFKKKDKKLSKISDTATFSYEKKKDKVNFIGKQLKGVNIFRKRNLVILAISVLVGVLVMLLNTGLKETIKKDLITADIIKESNVANTEEITQSSEKISIAKQIYNAAVSTMASVEINWKGDWGVSVGNVTIYGGSETDDGGLITGGMFSGTVNFGNGISITSNGSSDGFVVKYNSDKEVEWAKSYGGASSDWIYTMDLANDSGYIVAGDFMSSQITVGNETITNASSNGNLNSAVSNDGIVIKYTKNGEIDWISHIGGNSSTLIDEIVTTNDNGFLVSLITSSSNINIDGNSIYGSSNRLLLIKYDSNGNFQWSKQLATGSFSDINSITQNSNGEYLITGEYSSNLQLSNGQSIYKQGSNDGIVIKCDSNGDINFVKTYGGSEYDVVNSAATTVDGGIVVGGYFESDNLYLDGGYNLENKGSSDGFIIKYDKNGNIVWAKSIGSIGSDSIDMVLVRDDGKIIAGGDFYNSIDLGNGINITSTGNSDIMLIQFSDNGEVELSKVIGGNSSDTIAKMKSTRDGGILIAGKSTSSKIDLGNGETINPNGAVLIKVSQYIEEKIDIKVTKQWNDNGNSAQKRPDALEIILKNGQNEIERQQISSSSNWTCTFSNLPKKDEDGNEINYNVSEQELDQDDLKFYSTGKITGSIEQGYTITNTFSVPDEKVNVRVTKNWEDTQSQSDKRPSQVTVKIQGGGNTKSYNLKSTENWTYTFTDLPKYDSKGNEINYTVEEVTTNKFYKQTNNTGSMQEGYIITNTFEVPNENITIPARIIWDDNENESGKRPENVTVQVKNGNNVVAESKVNEDSDWNHEFIVPKYDSNGNEINYTIDEADLDNKFYDKGNIDQENGTITNISRYGKVIVHYYIQNSDGTNTRDKVPNEDGKEIQDVLVEGRQGEDYITSEAENVKHNYELVEIPANAQGKFEETPTEVTYYYKLKKYDYTVNYFYDGIKDDTLTSNLSATWGTKITNYEDKVKTGYVLSKTENIPLTITENAENNRINIYYVKDTFKYKVEYYYDGKINEKNTEENTAIYQEVIKNYDDKNITGYKLEKTENLPLTISADEEENVIKVYYIKRTDLSYTVNYYEQDSENKLHESKEVNNVTFNEVVTEEPIDIEGYNKVSEDSQKITIGVDNNEINFYYTKRTDLSYTVRYLEKGTDEELAKTKTVGNKTYKDSVTEEAIEIAGYNAVDPTQVEITIGVENNIINFYYEKKTDIKYRVEYYYDGKINAENTEEYTATFKDEITEYENKNITGYKLEKTENLPLTISANEEENVIKVYYVKNTFKYTVEYYYDGKIDEERTKEYTAIYQDKITEYEDKNITGYKLEKTENLPLTITEKEENNVIKIYYVKRTDLSYVVNYYEKDTENKIIESKEVEGITFNQKITEEPVDIEGYNKVSEDSQKITIGEENNVINFYYTKRTDLSYTVNYLEKGTETPIAESKTVDKQTYKDSVTEEAIEIPGYNAQEPTQAEITIGVENNIINFYYEKKTDIKYRIEYYYDGKINDDNTEENTATYEDVIENYDDKNITGYKLDRTENLPLTIGANEEENVIKIYYAKRTDLSYVVNYYEKDTENKIIESKEVDGVTFNQEITEEPVDIEGYNKISEDSQKITIGEENNVINFYYTKRTDLSYTVKYLEQGTDEELSEAKVVENKTFKDSVTEEAIEIPGYNKIEPTQVEITIGVNKNEIIFYYQKKTDIKYRVEYYYEGNINEENTEEYTATYQDKITEYKDKNITGYKLEKTENLPLTISANEEENVIKVYYVKDTFKYKVEYYYDGKINEKNTEENTATYQDKITEYEDKNITGYKLEKTENLPLTITENPEKNVVKVYYVKRTDLSYTVNYYEQDSENKLHESKVVNNVTFNEVVVEEPIDIEGYNKVSENSQQITIGVANNEINFYYTKRTDLSYTVKYLEQGTDEELSEAKVVENKTFKDSVTEEAIEIPGYNKIEPTQVEITIGVNKNEIIFYYQKKTDIKYRVEYYYDGKISDDNTEEYTATFKDEITEYKQKNMTGYKLEKTENLPLTIGANEEENVIKVYYVKDTFKYKVEYYYDGKINEENTEEYSATYEDVIEDYNDKNIAGYRLEKTENLPLTITENLENNVIKVYYVKRTDLSYVVNYYEKDTENKIIESKEVGGVTFNQEITEEPVDIEGYNKVSEEPQKITIGEENNVINFYYEKRTDLSYTVNYLEKGTETPIAESKTVDKQTYKDSVTEKAIEIPGYNKIEPIQVEITIGVENNVINFYYEKKTDIKYRVEYYYDGEINAENTEENTATYEDVIENYDDKNITGYKLDRTENLPLTIGANEEENVIKIYYAKRTDLSYVVNYYEKDTENKIIESKEVDGVTFNQEITEEPVDIEGYNKVSEDSQKITIGEENNVINFYYTKRTDLSYTVKYLEQGTDEELSEAKVVENKTFKDSVTEEAIEIPGYNKIEPTQVEITIGVNKNEIIFYYQKKTDIKYRVEYYYDGKISDDNTEEYTATFKDEITEYKQKNMTGYKLEKTENLPLTIGANEEENVIKVYYVKDTFKYKVEYYYDGKINAENTEEYAATYQDVIENYKDKNITGYRLEKVENLPLTISANAEENVIKVYYIKRTNLSYTVNYYEQDSDNKLHESKVVNDVTFNEVIVEEPIDIEGYNKVSEDSQKITIGVDNNEINFYYTKRTDLSYTVRYLEKGTDEELAKTKTVGNKTFKESITEEAIEIPGYNAQEPIQVEITIGVENNVINFYYEKKTDIKYRVEYYYDGEINAENTEENTATYEDVIENYDDKNITGYKLDRTENLPLTIGANEEENVIKIYYAKRTDLSYVVNYYEKDTENKIIESKEVDGVTFNQEITEEPVDIEGYNKISEDSQKITIGEENNVINFYYEKRTDLSYTVNYLEKGTETPIAESKTIDKQTYKDSVTEEAIEIPGYNKIEPIQVEITIGVENNVINFYYEKKTDIKYRVEYYYDGEINAENTEENTATYEDVIENYDDKNITGYKLDRTENLPLTIGANEEENVIKVYYVKDTFKYKVEYYYDGEINEENTEEYTATYQDVIKTYEDKNITGYKLAGTENLPLTVSENSENNVIKVYYVKDIFGYKVEYYYDGKIDNKKTETIEATYGDVIESYTDKNITGYRLEKTENLPLTVSENSENNVIKVYYVKDTFKYKVEYYYDGEINAENTEENTATYQDVIEDYDDKNITGYRLEKTENLPLTITENPENNVIKVYYVKRTDLSYIVNYYEKDTENKIIESKEVGGVTFNQEITEEPVDIEGYNKISEEPQKITIGEGNNVINFYYTKRTDLSYTVRYLEKGTDEELAETKVVANKTYKDSVTEKAIEIPGYNAQEPTETEITIGINKNEIIFYYQKKTDIKYRVEYYYDGKINEGNTEEYTATFKDEITEYKDKNITGYKLEKTENLPLTISANSDNNVIKIYYVKDIFEYKVEYYYDGKINEENTEKYTATYQDVIENYNDKNITGYRLEKTENLPLTITENPGNNVIKVYYVKRTDLGYVVNYYEKDTENKIIDSKKVDGVTFNQEITEKPVDIEGYNKISEDSQKITIGEENNVINFYYEKRTDLSYTVNYLEKGTETPIAESKTVDKQTYKDSVIEEAIEIPGYNKIEPTEAEITIGVENNVINFYYEKKTDIKYRIEYYYDGKINDDNTEENTATYEDVIENYDDKNITGYKLDRTENLPLTIGANEEENVIKVYYVKDTFKYKVEYYYDGKINAENTEEYTATYQDVIKTYEDKNITGYKLAGTENLPLTVSENSENNVIKVYYVKDIFGYKVEYYYDAKIDNEKTETIEATYGEEINTYPDKNITGYKLEKVEGLPLTVSENVEDNVIKVYYVKDTFKYKVEYYYDGKINEENTEEYSATYEDVIEDYNDKNIAGYRLEKTENLPLTITENLENNVIKVYYVKRTDLSYVVNYYEKDTENKIIESKEVGGVTFNQEITEEPVDIEGYNKVSEEPQKITIGEENNVINFYYEKRTDLSYTVNYLEKGTETPIAESKTVDKQTYKDSVTEKAIEIPGYNKIEPIQVEITIGVENNVINFYYEKKTDIKYRVEYYYDGEINAENTEENTATYEDVIENYDDKNITGYKLDRTENLPLTIGANEEENVIKVYYVKDTFKYKVEYYYDGKINAENTEEYAATYQDVIENYNDKNITGYRLDKVENLPLTITENSENNVIKVYYVKRTDLSYVVNYYEKDTENKIIESKEVGGVTFNQEITEEPVDIEGYNKVSEEPQKITIGEENNVINFYYEKRTDLSYTVNYLEKGTETPIAESKTVDKQTYKDSVTEKAIEIPGYNKIEPIQVEITIGVENNVINFYYEKKTDIKYRVEYYYDGVINAENTEENTATYQDIIDTYTDKNITGYRLNNVENLPLTITENTETNVIKVYYVRKDAKVIVKYLEKETNKELDQSANYEINGKVFDNYQTEQKEFTGYNFVESTNNISGIMTENPIEVIYYYELKTPYITNEEISKNATTMIQNLDSEITYNISYNVKLNDYIGETEIKIVDSLPYAIDELKSNLAGGSYNPDTMTITWVEKISDINSYENKNNEIEINKNITIVYNELTQDTTKIENNVAVNIMTKTPEKIFETLEASCITNTDFTVDIPVSKIWNDDSNKLGQRPTSVIFRISGSDGSQYTKELMKPGTAGSTTTTDSDNKNKWNDIFENLPKFDNSRNKIEYTLAEEEKTTGDLKYYDTWVDKESNIITNISKYGKIIVHYYIQNVDGTLTTNRVPDINGIEIPDITIEGKEGTPYSVTEANNVSNKYELVEEKLPANAEGKIEKYNESKPQEVIYYYRLKPAKVIINYLEKDGDTDDTNNQVLSEQEQIDGHVDDKYNTDTEHRKETIAYNGKTYTLVEDSKNTEGTMTVEDINVTYYYLQNTKATVRYVERDPETHEIIRDLEEPRTEEGLVGDEFVTTEKAFTGYRLVEAPENKTIKMTKEEQTLIYYYEPVYTGLVENHIDDKTGKVLYTETHNVQVGQDYNIPSKEFAGYDLVESKLPTNNTGIMGEELVTVNYYYIKKAVLEVNYIDVSTNEPLTEPTVDNTKHEGDFYTTEEILYENYDLLEVPNNKEGIMQVEIDKDGNIVNNKTVVTYLYIRKAQIEEHHIDIKTGADLEEPIVHNGHIGEEYNIPPKEFLGYSVAIDDGQGNNMLPTNSAGKYTEEKQIVTYYYYQPAKVVVHYVDMKTEEEIEEINADGNLQSSQVTIEGTKDDAYVVAAKMFKYYNLVKKPVEEGTMKVEITKDENGKDIVNNTIDVYYYYEPKTFNIGVDKTISKVTVNGKEQNISNNKLTRVEIYRKNVNDTKVEIEYTIKVTNNSEVDGKAIIREDIPDGMSVINNDETWDEKDGYLEKVIPEIKAGETKEYKLTLAWNRGDRNLGEKDNKVEITQTDNVPGFKDGNSEDNSSEATVMINVSTGSVPWPLIIALIALAGLETVTLSYARVITNKQKKNRK